jgi:transposase
MEVQYQRCAGLDVHKDTVVACVRVQDGKKVKREVRTFGTMTSDLLEMSDWFTNEGVTHLGMEATGVYWRPVWHVLDGHFEMVLANAAHIKNVPRRKTDVKDAEWIADRLAHGLIRSSFVPDATGQQMRDLTRTRKQLMRERVRHVQRIQKVLEDANVKIASVITDIMGMSGRAFLDAMIAGESDPEVLVELASPRLKRPREEIVEALRGFVTSHHRFMIRLHLGLIAGLDAAWPMSSERWPRCWSPFASSWTS